MAVTGKRVVDTPETRKAARKALRASLKTAKGQTSVRRTLAGVRDALGARGVRTAMKTWGIRASKSSSSGKGGARGGGRATYSGRNG